MSQRIARLLGEPEKTVTDLIAGLEKNNGHPKNDVRHIAEIHQKVRVILGSLGLDPDDTTAPELFHALQSRFEDDTKKLDWQYEAAAKSFEERGALVSQLLKSNMSLPKLWVLKKNHARQLIGQHPPKHVMKAFHYRSIQSMLKHEDILSVYLATEVMESAAWRKAHGRLISKLDQSAFELREIVPVALDSEKFVETKAPEPVISSAEIGAVAVMPSAGTNDLPVLPMTLLLADKLSYYGADMKRSYLIDGSVGWWAKAHDLMTDLDGQPVSLNLQDVAASYLYSRPFESRQVSNGRQNYWQSLLKRYENVEQAESLFDSSVMQRVRKLKFDVPEPAFEYDFAEDF